ncbi:hypothetical protein ACFU7Z_29640 [Kitasatospora sp. NPDC057518]|uniref:hypothetical protein n=1 Tax=Kitasatospora sp. NPDC057518 TaxID=3346155 RepID=UPI0036B1308F
MRSLTSTLKSRMAPVVLLAACTTALAAPHAAAAPNSVAPGSTAVDLWVKNYQGLGTVKGTLSWDGEGGYSFVGTADATCDVASRVTAWLEYGGAGESWKQSAEADCKKSPRVADVKVSGTLNKGEKLELRVSSWREWAIDAYRASAKQVYTIS